VKAANSVLDLERHQQFEELVKVFLHTQMPFECVTILSWLHAILERLGKNGDISQHLRILNIMN